ncbi:hypothetical protein B0J11DRAFT_564554 [Dendryphion nanum]|uniref:Uncharacterized protein n=1 Tax=Dendryphion nanum TaxID=256645 RepID=A0A9P9EDL0_9PLEO|nr:hypothetical protein B0J11DRAFT_564554 [Dendryphion nanum]
MRLIIAALFSLVSNILAAPFPDENYGEILKRKTYTAKYDDLAFIEPGPNPIPAGYNGLEYTTFQVDQYDGFIPPTSGDKVAMAFGGSGNFSVPASPPRQSIELDSFSFACVAGIPQPECAISIWGWKTNGKVIKRVITFPRLDPGHVIEDFKMNRTSFSQEWRDLQSVGFSIARKDNGGDMYGGLALDDVKYTITKEN